MQVRLPWDSEDLESCSTIISLILKILKIPVNVVYDLPYSWPCGNLKYLGCSSKCWWADSTMNDGPITDLTWPILDLGELTAGQKEIRGSFCYFCGLLCHRLFAHKSAYLCGAWATAGLRLQRAHKPRRGATLPPPPPHSGCMAQSSPKFYQMHR